MNMTALGCPRLPVTESPFAGRGDDRYSIDHFMVFRVYFSGKSR